MSFPRTLAALPTELGLQIFELLDSLCDVISLAAASRAWRHIWLEHATSIYCQVAPRCIEGETHARQLQLAILGNRDVTPENVLGIMRRARFVNNIIPQFEEKVASKFSAFCLKRYYKNQLRPKHLTTTERCRFIRTYYQLWAHILLDESTWKSNIDASSIKQIYLLREMCRIPLPIGDYPPGEILNRWPVSYDARSQSRRGRFTSALQQAVDAYIESVKTCYEDPWLECKATRSEGYAGFYLLWDHGKHSLRGLALDRYPAWPENEYERKHRWVDSSDEEDDI